jgi:uncharacterized protein DUF1194/PEP-CTERM motif-containing protein
MKPFVRTLTWGLLLLSSVSAAHAVPVDLELVLLTDNSGSISGADFALSRQGYQAAFQSAAVQTAIVGGTLGQIAVTLLDFSGNAQQNQSVPWTLINSAATANAFGAAVGAAPRSFSGGTGITAGVNASAALLAANNGFEGTRLVIDVVGDGAESEVCAFSAAVCAPLQAARAAALAGGVTTINALWIDDRDFFGDDPADTIQALPYGLTNVIGGANPSQAIVEDFSDFAPAIRAKLEREVTGGVPEPGTTALIGLALLGLSLVRRRAG